MPKGKGYTTGKMLKELRVDKQMGRPGSSAGSSKATEGRPPSLPTGRGKGMKGGGMAKKVGGGY